ncbi:MAG: putative photosynthetic complex assembly protein PuhE [Thiohalocapsa sp.]
MLSYGVAVGYALFLWWFSTGVILYLDKRPTWTYRWSLLGATALASFSFVALHLVQDLATPLGAYVGFTAGVLIWGWMEMSYFMGFITGPRKVACPQGCGGWRRFFLAIQTSLYHELAIVAAGAGMIWITWDGLNQAGTWTYVILWSMRWSAKLNLFLGVPNLNEEWLPEHIRFLTSYLSKRPMNLLFPVSVSVATVVMCLLVEAALDLPSGSFAGVALMLTATMLALAILEHWFLVLPLADAALWSWALDARDRGRLAASLAKPADAMAATSEAQLERRRSL